MQRLNLQLNDDNSISHFRHLLIQYDLNKGYQMDGVHSTKTGYISETSDIISAVDIF